MDTDPPQHVSDVPTEMEAAIVIARLDGEGIEAWAEGGIIGGFRAEAPGGSSSIYVHAADYERALTVLRQDGEPPRDTPPATRESPRRARPLRMIVFAIGAIAVLLVIIRWALTLDGLPR